MDGKLNIDIWKIKVFGPDSSILTDPVVAAGCIAGPAYEDKALRRDSKLLISGTLKTRTPSTGMLKVLLRQEAVGSIARLFLLETPPQ